MRRLFLVLRYLVYQKLLTGYFCVIAQIRQTWVVLEGSLSVCLLDLIACRCSLKSQDLVGIDDRRLALQNIFVI